MSGGRTKWRWRRAPGVQATEWGVRAEVVGVRGATDHQLTRATRGGGVRQQEGALYLQEDWAVWVLNVPGSHLMGAALPAGVYAPAGVTCWRLTAAPPSQ